MLMSMPHCDHCDALLRVGKVERDRKRFCCVECLRAYMDGALKAISPHDHSRLGGIRVKVTSEAIRSSQRST